MNTALWKSVSQALQHNPSEQPVGYQADDAQKADSTEKNDQKKPSGAVASGYKAKQRGNPNKSYPVSIIDKARAKLG